MNIQWYPGHMAKTKKMIKDNLKLVDVVLELTDARAPLSTHLPDIDSLIGNKNSIMIMNKADLADKKITDMWLKYFKKQGIKAIAVNSLKKSELKNLYNLLGNVKKKTVLRSTRCMIIGIPNVGKSSLINQMAGRKSARTADIPGVTRNKMWLKVGDNLELLDTPGILWPKFEDKTIGIKLAILGSIKQELLDFEKLSLILIKYLLANYPQALKDRYGVDSSTPAEILEKIARNRGFLVEGGVFDINRSAKTLINEFRQGKLGRISLEKPEEKEGFWLEIANQDIV